MLMSIWHWKYHHLVGIEVLPLACVTYPKTERPTLHYISYTIVPRKSGFPSLGNMKEGSTNRRKKSQPAWQPGYRTLLLYGSNSFPQTRQWSILQLLVQLHRGWTWGRSRYAMQHPSWPQWPHVAMRVSSSISWSFTGNLLYDLLISELKTLHYNQPGYTARTEMQYMKGMVRGSFVVGSSWCCVLSCCRAY